MPVCSIRYIKFLFVLAMELRNVQISYNGFLSNFIDPYPT